MIGSKKEKTIRGRKQARYPWREWFKTGKVDLVRGKDYECTSHGMWHNAKRAARAEGYRIRVEVKEGSVSITVTGRRVSTRVGKARRQPDWKNNPQIKKRAGTSKDKAA